jgi:type I restriction enzyme, S subunit
VSFPRYEAYRHSGAEWLGEVPVHWVMTSLGRVTVERCDGPFGSGLKSDHYMDAGVRVVRLQNIRQGAFDDSDAAFIDEGYFRQELARHEVREGDLLIAGLGDERNTVGRACVAPRGVEPAMVKADCFRFRVDRRVATPTFLAAQLTAGAAADAGRLAAGSTRARISLSEMATRAVALPPISEQHSIMSFLEAEAAKIDALVAEQKRLIKLLTEKRQAVISHAVTKGLNLDAPMKASGVEWLGDVPAHWTVDPLRRFDCLVQTGPFGSQLHAEEYVLGATPVINPVNLVEGHIVPSDDVTVPDDVVARLAHQRLRVGDIVFSRRGELGRCALVTDREIGWLCGTGCMIVRLHHLDVRGAYLSRYLSLPVVRQYFESFSVGAIMDSLSASTLLGMPLLVPPAIEQEQIADVVLAQSEDFSRLIEEAGRGIELLNERRTALISAAVSGRIDVRALVDAEAVAA